jgi:hypothetical protein
VREALKVEKRDNKSAGRDRAADGCGGGHQEAVLVRRSVGTWHLHRRPVSPLACDVQILELRSLLPLDTLEPGSRLQRQHAL